MSKLKIKKKFVIIIVLIAIYLIYLISQGKFITGNRYNNYSDYQVLHEFGEANNSNTIYGQLENKYIVKCTNDGIKLMDFDENFLWDQVYTMSKPMLVIEGKYIVVADLKGQDIYLFDKEGLIKKINTNYAIIDIELNKMGFISTIEDNNDEHYINLYNKSGELIAGSKTYFDKNGFPMHVSISKDGTKMVTSFYYIDGINTENRITFYNFGEVGENYGERIVGGYLKKDVIIPKIKFLTNERVVAFGDEGIYFYKVDIKPEETNVIKIENEIISILYSEDYLGLVTEGDNKELMLYDIMGNKNEVVHINFDYDKITTSKEEIIFYDDWSCNIYYKNGKLKWQNEFDYAIQEILPLNENKYIIVTSNQVHIIKLK